MNLYLNGIEDFSIACADTLTQPAFLDGSQLRKFDIVLANPPYSIKQWNREAFANDKWGRNFLGTPPQGRADYAFIQHILASMNPDTGRCAILLPHGILFRKEEQEIRKNLIEKDLIEAVIGLGPNLFFNAPMEACVLVCRNRKPANLKNKIIFINAVKEVTRKNAESYLEPTHIEKIVSAYVSSNDIADFKRIVTNNEVADNDFDLSIQKYVFLNDYEATYIDIDGAISEWTAISKVSSENLDSLIKMLNEYDI